MAPFGCTKAELDFLVCLFGSLPRMRHAETAALRSQRSCQRRPRSSPVPLPRYNYHATRAELRPQLAMHAILKLDTRCIETCHGRDGRQRTHGDCPRPPKRSASMHRKEARIQTSALRGKTLLLEAAQATI